jgi:hypothetical protein
MFSNLDRDLIAPDHGPGLGVTDVTFNVTTPARLKWPRRHPHPDRRIPLTGGPFVSCPQCMSAIRDRIAASAGYCARCQDFTLMCAAGRSLLSPDVMSRTGWHWPCTSAGITRWQVTNQNGVTTVLLCAAHGSELASGRVSWIVHPVFIGT